MADPEMVQLCLQHTARLDEHERRLDQIDEHLRDHDETLYGREQLGLTARVKLVEEAIAEQRRVRRWLLAVLVTAGMNLLGNLASWWSGW